MRFNEKNGCSIDKTCCSFRKKNFFPLPIGLNSAGFGADASISRKIKIKIRFSLDAWKMHLIMVRK